MFRWVFVETNAGAAFAARTTCDQSSSVSFDHVGHGRLDHAQPLIEHVHRARCIGVPLDAHLRRLCTHATPLGLPTTRLANPVIEAVRELGSACRHAAGVLMAGCRRFPQCALAPRIGRTSSPIFLKVLAKRQYVRPGLHRSSRSQPVVPFLCGGFGCWFLLLGRSPIPRCGHHCRTIHPSAPAPSRVVRCECVFPDFFDALISLTPNLLFLPLQLFGPLHHFVL